MGIFTIFLLALGLCFDTFAVSVSGGMGCCTWSRGRGVRFATVLGLMQGLMPLIGWLLAAEFHTLIAVWDHWIAFVLLLFLGGKMVISGIRSKGDQAHKDDPFRWRNTLLLGLATSIDALIAGVALALVKVTILPDSSQCTNILLAVGIIAAVTIVASLVGLLLGHHTKGRLGARAEIIGGVILVLIGTKVLCEHLQQEYVCDEPLTVMSFNIRYDNPDDGRHQWSHRREAVVRMLADQKPTVVGIQEGLSHQVAYLDSVLTGYKYIGVGRDDGDRSGEYAAIFYDTTRLEAIQTGNFWLCETPDRPALGWDAVCVRIATWGLFEDQTTARRFFAVNTHFDHIGTTARAESGRLIIRKIDSIAAGTPLVLTGDFNCTIEDQSLSPIMESMTDARPSASREPAYTFIGFDEGNDFVERQIIDHIFLRDMHCAEFHVITDTYGVPAGQLSDHLPIVANLTIH